MSEENVNFVRAVFSAFAQGDVVPFVATLDPDDPHPGLAAAFAPDVEVVWSVNAPDQREYRGHRGLVQAYKDWMEAFSEYYVEDLEFIDAGDEVIVPHRHRGIGAGSGIEVVQDLVHVFTVRGGQIARIREYDSLEETQAAVEAGG